MSGYTSTISSGGTISSGSVGYTARGGSPGLHGLPTKNLSWSFNPFSIWVLIPLAVCVAWLLIKLVNKQKHNKAFHYLYKSMKNGADTVAKVAKKKK